MLAQLKSDIQWFVEAGKHGEHFSKTILSLGYSYTGKHPNFCSNETLDSLLSLPL